MNLTQPAPILHSSRESLSSGVPMWHSSPPPLPGTLSSGQAQLPQLSSSPACARCLGAEEKAPGQQLHLKKNCLGDYMLQKALCRFLGTPLTAPTHCVAQHMFLSYATCHTGATLPIA